MSRMFLEVAGVILNVDRIIAVSPTERTEPNGVRYPATRVLMADRDAPLILEVEFAEFRRLLDRLLNQHVTEADTIRYPSR